MIFGSAPPLGSHQYNSFNNSLLVTSLPAFFTSSLNISHSLPVREIRSPSRMIVWRSQSITDPSVCALATALARRRRSISAAASQTSANTILALSPRGCRPDTSRSRATRSSASAPSDGKAGLAIASSENATSLADTRALRENTSVVLGKKHGVRVDLSQMDYGIVSLK